MRRVLNEVLLPGLKAIDFNGKFPLLTRQRECFSDCIALQCNRHAPGLILHLKVFDAAVCPASSHRFGQAIDVEPQRGGTVSPRLFATGAPYWFSYNAGDERKFAEQMTLWIPAIDEWFHTGKWQEQSLPQSFRPQSQTTERIGKLLNFIRKGPPR